VEQMYFTFVDPPSINDQGKEAQTTFYDHFSRSSAGRQGGRQFFPRRLAHPEKGGGQKLSFRGTMQRQV